MSEKGTVVVIGSGAAGSSCARYLADYGWRVVLAEHDRWGGTCLWRGCIPKKALFHGAHVARTVAGAEQFGIACGEPSIDWQGVAAWKWHSQETYAGDQRAHLASKGIALAEASARFVSAEEVEVAGERIGFDHAVIATGSRAVMPPLPGIELADSSDDALRYPELPRSLAIVGGGYIAMEMAGIFASFGTRVTVLVRGDRLLDGFDPELAAAGRRGLERLGVRFMTGCSVTGLTGERGSLRLTYAGTDAHDGALDCERVLMATGRAPVLDGIGLDEAGVETDGKGHLVLDPFLRTTNPVVWAVGDAAGGMMQTPVASAEGRAVAASIETGPTVPDCSSTPVCCFTVPELATVGLSASAAQREGRKVEIHTKTLESLGAAIIEDTRDGFCTLVTDPGGRVLGGQIAAPHASLLIYSVAVAVRCGATLEDLKATPTVHPSMSDAVFDAAWA